MNQGRGQYLHHGQSSPSFLGRYSFKRTYVCIRMYFSRAELVKDQKRSNKAIPLTLRAAPDIISCLVFSCFSCLIVLFACLFSSCFVFLLVSFLSFIFFSFLCFFFSN